MLARLSGDDTVRNPSRQFVRPLPHCVVRDADGRGRSRDGSAEQFEGFGLEHGQYLTTD